MFRNNNKDVLLILILAIQIFVWHEIKYFYNSADYTIMMFFCFLQIFLIGTNYQCVSHNFIHNPFFKLKILNKLFSLINSIGILFSQTLYKYHHLNHHRFNNDRGENDIKPKDLSSIYYHSKTTKPESFLSYALLSPFRSPIHIFYRQALTQKQHNQSIFEFFIIFLFLSALIYLTDSQFLLIILTIFYFGQVFAFAENYLEHNNASGSDRKNDSVSCYNRIYNVLWFNNGYHQEHHYSPQTHWTKIKSVRKELNKGHRIVRICHFTNF